MATTFNPQDQGMGVGEVGVGDLNTIYKRKFRYTLEIKGVGACDFLIPPHFVQVANRPQISIEEVDVHFLNHKSIWPGKPSWEPMTATYFDAVGPVEANQLPQLLKWLTGVYNFDDRNELMTTKREDYLGEATLELYDGCGKRMEQWIMFDCWPQAINFGDLDMSSSEVVGIELTMRYSFLKYTTYCGEHSVPCECPAC